MASDMWNVGGFLHRHLSKEKKSSSYLGKDMKRIIKLFLVVSVLGGLGMAMTGCTNLMEEDPNEAQIPWATPADWEGTVPGMPTGGGY